MRRTSYSWILGASIFGAALVWACGEDLVLLDPPPPTPPAATTGSPPSAPGPGLPSGSSSGGDPFPTPPVVDSGDTADAETPEDAGTTEEDAAADSGIDAGADAGSLPAATPATVPTEANLKVAFIGDTGTGQNLKDVLALIRRENAKLVMFQGDLNYIDPSLATVWFATVDGEINATFPGSAAPVTIPYFASKGNHDIDWNPGFASGFDTRLAQWGITPQNGTPAARNYSIVHKGLQVVMVDESETTPSRADYVTQQLSADNHLWKICSWHKNQRDSQVGPKSDEMGWEIYERCRRYGAIVAQGHSHTYSRSKTLTNDANLTVDSTCSDPFGLCVSEGRHFFFDSSLGGQDIRAVTPALAALPHFASSFAGNYGALFIEFNVGGDPKKAEGYFKTITDVVTDPPASSGKTRFTITRTP